MKICTIACNKLFKELVERKKSKYNSSSTYCNLLFFSTGSLTLTLQ